MTNCPECHDLFEIPFYIENGNFFCPHCGTHLYHTKETGTVIRVVPVLRDNKEHLEKVFVELEKIFTVLGAIWTKGTENVKYYNEHVNEIPAGDVANLVIKTIESQKETIKLAILARDVVRREQRNMGSQWEQAMNLYKNYNVLILRGVFGSGKSTFAKKLARKGIDMIFSVDNYFMENGQYEFDPERLEEVHSFCLRDFILDAKRLGEDLSNKNHQQLYQQEMVESGEILFDRRLVVDNTNCTVEEIAPYYAVAEAFKLKPLIVNLWVDPEVASDRNVHGVSLTTIKTQNDKMRTICLPSWWDAVNVVNPSFGE